MNNIPIGDAIFLLGEAAGRPAQVITLQLYRPPADAEPVKWVGDYFQHCSRVTT